LRTIDDLTLNSYLILDSEERWDGTVLDLTWKGIVWYWMKGRKYAKERIDDLMNEG
jgi:hypothetical protein